MDTCVFTFGPDSSFMYNAPTQWKWSKHTLPTGIISLLPQFKDIIWAAFGETLDSYFVSYVNKQAYGPGVPATFKVWLTDPETGKIRRNKHSRVTFGLNESFVAWDSTSIRWHNVPTSLDEIFQEWLSPAGWKFGPPRIVCLGQEGAYLAITEHGWWAYKNLPGDMKAELDACGKDYGVIQAATLSMFGPHYVALVGDGGWYCYDIPDSLDEENEEAICGVLDSFGDATTIASHKAGRAVNRRKRLQEDLKKRKERLDEARKAQQAKATYQTWSKQCELYFASTEPRTVFKHPPQSICQCREVVCISYKQAEGSIGACRHDMEALLRASGQYTLTWLKKDRLKWHPDQFGKKCDSIFRTELSQKSTQMYSLYEELIAIEVEKLENGGQGGGG